MNRKDVKIVLQMFHILKKGEENMVLRRETENIRDPNQTSRDKNKSKLKYILVTINSRLENYKRI